MSQTKIGLVKTLKSSGSRKVKVLKLLDLIGGTLIAGLIRGKNANVNFNTSIQKILVIRPGGIGDAIFLLPFLNMVKESNPALKIHILCEKRNAQVFSSQPQTHDRLYRYDNPFSLLSLFGNRYDVVIDSEQWHYLSALVAYFLKSEQTVGFATRPLRSKLFNQKMPYSIESYETVNFSRLFNFLTHDKKSVKDINSCYTLPEDLISWATGEIPPKSITLFLGASIPERRLTEQQSLDIISGALEMGYHVVLLGGHDVLLSSEKLLEKVKDDRVLSFVGKVSLQQSAALIKQSELFIGTDSGLMHLACAVGAPVVAIFGPGNLTKWSPKGERHVIITENVTCSPCTEFGYTVPTCNGSYHCMRDIKIPEILDAVKTMGSP